MRLLHYWTNFPNSERGTWTTACGASGKDSNSNVWPTHVICKRCKATKRYIADLYAFEIGYDGNKINWNKYQTSLKHESKKKENK